jgi:transposase
MNPSVSSTSLFTLALGLQAPWEVVDAAFDPAGGHLDLQLGFASGARFACPCCGAQHQGVHDTLERTWRHLNFFQYQALLHAKVPRVRCQACGKTSQVPVPWAREGSGFTLLMEALLVSLCQAMPVRQVAQLLAVSDMRVWRTLDHYVDQARAQEDFSMVSSIGLDETAARRGHDYISLFHDLDAGRLLFGCEGRKGEVVETFAEDLEAHTGCAENIKAVCVDMSASYRSGIETHLPWAEITFDEFHVIQLVNKALDEVRRQEVKDHPCLKRTRYIWLKDKRDWSNHQTIEFHDLKRLNLKTHRAFRIKEALREIFHTAPDRQSAQPLLERWYSWVGIPLIPATDSEPNRPPVPKDCGRLFRRIPAGHSDLNRPPCELTRPGYWLCNLRSSVRSTHCVFFASILRADVSCRRCAPDGRGSHRPGWPGRGTHANVRAAAGWSRWSSAC